MRKCMVISDSFCLPIVERVDERGILLPRRDDVHTPVVTTKVGCPQCTNLGLSSRRPTPQLFPFFILPQKFSFRTAALTEALAKVQHACHVDLLKPASDSLTAVCFAPRVAQS